MKTPLLLSSAILAAPAFAQQPAATPAPTSVPSPTAISTPTPDDSNEKVIVVTAERNPQPLSQTPSTVTVITREQIEAKKPFDIVDLLRLVPGISLSQSGTYGKTTSVFTRGTNSNHTLVLVDGVRANNPSDGRFDFGQIPVENIERIEIVRGPGSALYGSDAIGGVINIITRKGDGEFKTGSQIEFGNYSTDRQSIDGHGKVGQTGVSFSLFRLGTNGNFSNDDYHNNGFSLRLDQPLTKNSNLAFIARDSQSRFGVPGQQDLAFDPFQHDNSHDTNYSLQFTNKAGKRNDKIIYGVYDRKLTDDDTRDPASPAPLPSDFKNRVRTIDAQSSYALGDHTFTAGIEERRETVDTFSSSSFGNSTYSDATTTRGLFAQDEFKKDRLTLVPSVRRERNSQFGSFTSYRLASAFAISPKTRLKASYGTAFKAPPFDSLYFPGFGNPNLQPERSRGFDLGAVRQIGNGSLEATYFNNRIKDLIGFASGAFTPTNIARAKTHGFEFSFDKPLSSGFRLIANQTFLHTDSSSGKLLRRPKFTSSADLIADRGRFNYDLGVIAQGGRYDANFVNNFTGIPYPGYTRVDLTVGYKIKGGSQFYVRAGNLLNRQYEEVAGFPAPHFNLSVGFRTPAF